MWKCIVVTGCLVCSLLILGAGEMNSQEAASTHSAAPLAPITFRRKPVRACAGCAPTQSTGPGGGVGIGLYVFRSKPSKLHHIKPTRPACDPLQNYVDDGSGCDDYIACTPFG